MKISRHFFAALAAATLTLATGPVLAATPTVEIIAMPHPPVRMALAPLREWLAAQGSKLRVIETDIESPQGEKRLAGIGLSGHIPVVILIDGQFRHKRKDGAGVEFMNFPDVAGAPPGVRGKWTTAEVQFVLNAKVEQP